MFARPLLLALAVAAGGLGPLQARQRVIAGRVTDLRTARPVSSGIVEIRGTAGNDQIRPDGVFVVRGPARDLTLVFRAAGYRLREVTVPAGQDTAFVALEPDVLALDGITVSGRATSWDRRNQATSSVAVGRPDVDGAPATGVMQTLQGKVAGADIQRNSGVPGGDLQLRLRGITTLLGPISPLFVLDGTIISNAGVAPGTSVVTGGQGPVPGRIADLNPNDIERIEILKGAAAAAMYGSKGSNGVVIITTRRGPR